jgi:hypothetical protein
MIRALKIERRSSGGDIIPSSCGRLAASRRPDWAYLGVPGRGASVASV